MTNETQKAGTAKPLNLLQRINNVRKKIDYIKKDKQVDAGAGAKYKAVTHDMVTAMVRDHLVAEGIICTPYLVKSLMAEPDLDKEGKPKQQRRYEATYDFTFMNEDDPQDMLVIRLEAHAMDNQDKAPGKALSYAKKNAVLKLFEIETGEDDESRSHEYDIDALVESVTNASDYEAALQAYNYAMGSATLERDRDGIALLRSVMGKVKAKFGKGDGQPEAGASTSGFNPKGKGGQEKQADGPTAENAQPDGAKQSPDPAPQATQSAASASHGAAQPQPAQKSAPAGEAITAGEANFLRNKAKSANVDEAEICARHNVSGNTFENATKDQWAAMKKELTGK